MIKSIFKRQNDEDVLELLYAQRVCYDRAEVYNRIGWAMTWLLLLQEIGSYIIPIIGKYSLTICAIAAIIIYFVDWRRTVYIEKGAQFKNLIDCILFEFPIDKAMKEKLIDYALELKSKNEEKYKQQISHNGDDNIKGVKDWYTMYSSENLDEIILNCQKQNLWWNQELVKYYKKALLACLAILVSITIISVCITKITLSILLALMILITTILIRCCDALKTMGVYTKSMIRAHGKLDVIEGHLDKVALLSLQEEIDAVRTSGFLIPNWVHAMYSIKLHKKRKELNNRINQ